VGAEIPLSGNDFFSAISPAWGRKSPQMAERSAAVYI